MLTTIEQKLSAIKAINEEIISLDENLDRLSRGKQIEIYAGIEGDYDCMENFPPTLLEVIRQMIYDYYSNRKKELVSKAEGLMK